MTATARLRMAVFSLNLNFVYYPLCFGCPDSATWSGRFAVVKLLVFQHAPLPPPMFNAWTPPTQSLLCEEDVH